MAQPSGLITSYGGILVSEISRLSNSVSEYDLIERLTDRDATNPCPPIN